MEIHENFNKTVAIVFWEDYLPICPTIISLAESFAGKSFKVDIYTTAINKRYPSICFSSNNISCFPLINDDKPLNVHSVNRFLNLFTKNPSISLIIGGLFKSIYKYSNEIKSIFLQRRFIRQTNPKIISENYQYIIICDATGLSASEQIIQYGVENIIYLSLELEYLKKLNFFTTPFRFLCQKNQIQKLHKIKNIIIQDVLRKNELINENFLEEDNHKFHFIPNSTSKPTSLKKSAYLPDLFNVTNIIILHLGMISDACLSLELAKSFKNQQEFSLVFHDKKFTDSNDPYIKLIKNEAGKNVYFSLNPVSLSELDKIILSAQIGVVVYNKKLGRNFELIANASGKMIMSLRLGIPIIILEMPGVREIFEFYNCGIVISDLNELIPAAQKIISNYTYYRNNALKCYSALYDFDKNFSNFYDFLNP